MVVIANDPVVESPFATWIVFAAVENRFGAGPGSRVGDGLCCRVGDPHLVGAFNSHLIDKVPFVVRREVEDLWSAVVVTVADLQDRAIRLVGSVPVFERAVFNR